MSLIGDDYGDGGRGSEIYTCSFPPALLVLVSFTAGAICMFGFIWSVWA